MALIVLFSTISITVEKHFCGDTLVDVAYFTTVEGCEEEVVSKDSKTKILKSCCKEEIEVLKEQSKLETLVFNDLDTEQQLFITSFAYSYINLFEGLSEQIIPHKNYSPPNLVEDIQLLDAVFII